MHSFRSLSGSGRKLAGKEIGLLKIFITGVKGQLGNDLNKELIRRGHTVTGSDLRNDGERLNAPAGEESVGCSEGKSGYLQLDITDEDAVMEAITRTGPDAVIHCAAWTDVDDAEDGANKEDVYAINVSGTSNVAAAAAAVGASMMYISTDYVFDGTGTEPRKPDDRDYAPLNYYGETKLEGELRVTEMLNRYFIVRISWVFGIAGNNFVKAIIKAGRTHDALRVVNDQIGNPTYTKHLAVLLSDMIETDRYGYYHVTNEGEFISWYDFACEIVRQAGIDTEVIPVSTEEYGQSLAARPENSRLDKTKLIEAGFRQLPHWRKALAEYIEEVQNNGTD